MIRMSFYSSYGKVDYTAEYWKKIFHLTFSKVKPDKSCKKRLLTRVGIAKETSERLYLQKAIEGLPPSSEGVAGNHM